MFREDPADGYNTIVVAVLSNFARRKMAEEGKDTALLEQSVLCVDFWISYTDKTANKILGITLGCNLFYFISKDIKKKKNKRRLIPKMWEKK